MIEIIVENNLSNGLDIEVLIRRWTQTRRQIYFGLFLYCKYQSTLDRVKNQISPNKNASRYAETIDLF